MATNPHDLWRKSLMRKKYTINSSLNERSLLSDCMFGWAQMWSYLHAALVLIGYTSLIADKCNLRYTTAVGGTGPLSEWQMAVVLNATSLADIASRALSLCSSRSIQLKCWSDMWLWCPLCLRICTLHYITCVHCTCVWCVNRRV